MTGTLCRLRLRWRSLNEPPCGLEADGPVWRGGCGSSSSPLGAGEGRGSSYTERLPVIRLKLQEEGTSAMSFLPPFLSLGKLAAEPGTLQHDSCFRPSQTV